MLLVAVAPQRLPLVPAAPEVVPEVVVDATPELVPLAVLNPVELLAPVPASPDSTIPPKAVKLEV